MNRTSRWTIRTPDGGRDVVWGTFFQAVCIARTRSRENGNQQVTISNGSTIRGVRYARPEEARQ